MGKIIGIIVVVLLGLFIFSGINTIPRIDENVKAKWSLVENQYERRAKLIPNLVATVKGYANFERGTLTDVIQARANATKVTINADSLSDPEAFKKYEAAQGQLSSALSRLMVVAEKYPDLKASPHFAELSNELEATENRIAVARKDYIDVVQEYNVAVRTFPTIIWAKIYGATVKPNFTASAGAEDAPKVEF